MNIPRKDLLVIFGKTNGRCFYCNRRGEEIDHFFPNKEHEDGLAQLGYSNDGISNLFLACRKCNRKKRDKFPEDFTGMGFLVWGRYLRANHRVGILKDMTVKQLLYG